MGAFARPRRSIRGPLGQDVRVSSRRGLADAIASAYATGSTVDGVFDPPNARWAGHRIIVDDLIRMKEGVEIPKELFGLHLLGGAKPVFLAESDGGNFPAAITVKGRYTRIDDIVFFGRIDGNPPNPNVRILVSGSGYGDEVAISRVVELTPDSPSMGGNSIGTEGDPKRLRIVDCELERLNLAGATRSVVRGCTAESISATGSELRIIGNTVTDTGISLNGVTRSVISANVIRSGGISAFGSSSNNAIQGNAMSNQNITTSGSLGGNAVTGNTEVGTLSTHASDAVGNNT